MRPDRHIATLCLYVCREASEWTLVRFLDGL